MKATALILVDLDLPAAHDQGEAQAALDRWAQQVRHRLAAAGVGVGAVRTSVLGGLALADLTAACGAARGTEP